MFNDQPTVRLALTGAEALLLYRALSSENHNQTTILGEAALDLIERIGDIKLKKKTESRLTVSSLDLQLLSRSIEGDLDALLLRKLFRASLKLRQEETLREEKEEVMSRGTGRNRQHFFAVSE